MTRFLFHLLLGTAVTLMIFLTSLLVPFIGVAISMLTPLPIMVLCRRWGIGAGILLTLIGTAVVSVLFNFFLGMVLFAEFGLLGLFLYHGLQKGWAWDRGVLVSSLVVMGTLALVMGIYGMATRSDPIELLKTEVHESMSAIFHLYPDTGAKQPATWMTPEKMTDVALRIFPAMVMMTLWVEGIINITLFARLARGSRPGDNRFLLRPEFSMWACPDRLVWGLIAAGFLLLTRVPPLVTISLNLLIILLTIYFLQGVAIISFWFKKKDLPMGLRVLGYIMIGLVQFLPFVVAAVGLFDIWGDFRKMRPKWQPKQ